MFLQPENGERFQWAPKFSVSLRNLRKKVESEDLVLAYFFSSEEEELSGSHENGQRFEVAAKELLEGEHELSLLMVDLKFEAPLDRDNILREYGVFKPHTYKLFINGQPRISQATAIRRATPCAMPLHPRRRASSASPRRPRCSHAAAD